jgi:hypothetical protein
MLTDDELIAGYVAHVDCKRLLPKPESPRQLAAYVATTKKSVEDDPHFWAWEAVHDAVDCDPERAWTVLLESLARSAPGREHIIGAGPLEELLIKWPRLLAKRTAIELARNERFESAFRVIRFSLDYATPADAEYFNSVLRQRGFNASLIPEWGPGNEHES